MQPTISLPKPHFQGSLSLEEAISRRRSIRKYRPGLITAAQIGQLLWSAQGITDPSGRRTAPSAGNLQSLELYVLLPEGLYRYLPQEHELSVHLAGDLRPQLASAALGQECVLNAAAVFVIVASVDQLLMKYGERSNRYAALEAGHSAQNLLLQATALGLAAVPAGAFIDDEVRIALQLPADRLPLYLVPVGLPE